MTDVERDRRALQVFVEVSGLAASARAAAVAHACSHDAELRARVEAMLAADAEDDAPIGAESDIGGFIARQVRQVTAASAAPTHAWPAPAGPPAVDGHYTILRVIGEGGMGTVYEAEQHHPRRRVAIKAIRQGRVTPETTKRFEYEAHLLARLEHHGIARLYESTAESDAGNVRAYLAMELVIGDPIDAYVAAKDLPLQARLALFTEVCDAVAYAHRMGVIHRDLKPANILVNAEGEPKILDFGVARTVEREPPGTTLLTQHGQIVGTLAYMSPEQVDGHVAVDTRSDVYSLGVILFKLLTGSLPIEVADANVVEASRRILSEPPRKLGRHDRLLRGDLEVLVGRALEKDPARRYASVDQLRDEIGRYLSGRPLEARRDARLYVIRKAVWRHRAAVSVGLLLAGLLTAFGVVASVQAGRNRNLARAAEAARVTAVDAEVRAIERAEALRRLLYFSNIGFAQSALENSDMERAHTLLDGCDPTLRDWEWSYLRRLSDLSSDTTLLGIDRPRYASMTSDRSLVALATLGREVVLREQRGQRELLRVRLPAGSARAAISADGRHLAYGGAVDAITVLEVATGESRQLNLARGAAASKPTPSALRTLAFSPDGTLLVAAGLDQHLRVWDVASASVRASISLGASPPICMAFSPAGDWVAVGDTIGSLRLFDVRSGSLLRALPGHDAPVWALAVSVDGKHLASGDNDARVIVWEPTTGQPLAQTDTNDGWITSLCFGPDGSKIAVGRADSTIRLVDLSNVSASGTLRGHRHAVVHIDWQSADSLRTLSLDGTAKSWRPASVSEVPTIATGQGECVGLAFGPGGRELFVGGGDGSVRSWQVALDADVQTREGRRLVDHAGTVLEVTVEPRSGRVITAGRDGIVQISSDDAGPPVVISPGSGAISAVAISPDGARLIVGAERELALWDARTGKKLREYFAPSLVVNEVTFDATGAFFYAACADGNVRRWNAESRSPVAEVMIDPGGLYDVRLSPDGRNIAVAGDSQSVTLLDAQTLGRIHSYVGHPGGVFAVAFHPTGQRIASAGTDGIIRIWDTESRTELITLRGHRRRIQHVAFSPDGRTLASSSDDGTVKLWESMPPVVHGGDVPD